jgi:hypothetical protein
MPMLLLVLAVDAQVQRVAMLLPSLLAVRDGVCICITRTARI